MKKLFVVLLLSSACAESHGFKQPEIKLLDRIYEMKTCVEAADGRRCKVPGVQAELMELEVAGVTVNGEGFSGIEGLPASMHKWCSLDNELNGTKNDCDFQYNFWTNLIFSVFGV